MARRPVRHHDGASNVRPDLLGTGATSVLMKPFDADDPLACLLPHAPRP